MLTKSNVELSTGEIIELAEDIIKRSEAHSNDGNPAISGPARSVIYWANRMRDDARETSVDQMDNSERIAEVYAATLDGVCLLLAYFALSKNTRGHLSDMVQIHILLRGMGSHFKD